ncbi:LPXTG cell wall anchor domain-containing protein [Micromonospora orduensis]|uniref:LPXTG cell wall anchor domain-containing protein n=1 Tax=Micromonospora orduensis TaxID=1420891 RepID=A0A5C4QM92_9ACTN|nr:LPXTG cell wall anchor domain-containing protein [Micromonospora orduensis]TNH28195.1 LPXTG cell wall anchor domain-containing protein [Micromonospora orduensis]
MTAFHRSALARAGVVALLAAGGLATVAAPAHAAETAEISLIPISTTLAKGVDAARAKPFKFTVTNSGSADAKDVVVRVDTRELKRKRVGLVPPADCVLSTPGIYSCPLGDLPAGTSEDFGIPLLSTGGRGNGGVLGVEVSTVTPQNNVEDDTVEVPITVAKPGYDLTAWVQDVQANVVVNGAVIDEPNLKPVPRGATVPLDWAVYNDGSRKATGVFFGLTLPVGVTFAKKPQGCLEQVYLGKQQLFCEDAGAVVKPGQYYTADVQVKVGDGVTEPVLHEGDLFAYGLDAAEGQPEEEPKVATSAQRKTFTEVDVLDNHTTFEAFVDLRAQPTPTPTPTATPTPGGTTTPGATTSPTTGGGGAGGGGLPVTGVQAGLIGGIGGLILLVGGALLVLSRRRKVVLVTPGDEKSTD